MFIVFTCLPGTWYTKVGNLRVLVYSCQSSSFKNIPIQLYTGTGTEYCTVRYTKVYSTVLYCMWDDVPWIVYELYECTSVRGVSYRGVQ